MSDDNSSHFPTRMFVRVRRVTMAVALAYTTPFTCGRWDWRVGVVCEGGGGEEGKQANRYSGYRAVLTVEEQ